MSKKDLETIEHEFDPKVHYVEVASGRCEKDPLGFTEAEVAVYFQAMVKGMQQLSAQGMLNEYGEEELQDEPLVVSSAQGRAQAAALQAVTATFGTKVAAAVYQQFQDGLYADISDDPSLEGLLSFLIENESAENQLALDSMAVSLLGLNSQYASGLALLAEASGNIDDGSTTVVDTEAIDIFDFMTDEAGVVYKVVGGADSDESITMVKEVQLIKQPGFTESDFAKLGGFDVGVVWSSGLEHFLQVLENKLDVSSGFSIDVSQILYQDDDSQSLGGFLTLAGELLAAYQAEYPSLGQKSLSDLLEVKVDSIDTGFSLPPIDFTILNVQEFRDQLYDVFSKKIYAGGGAAEALSQVLLELVTPEQIAGKTIKLNELLSDLLPDGVDVSYTDDQVLLLVQKAMQETIQGYLDGEVAELNDQLSLLVQFANSINDFDVFGNNEDQSEYTVGLKDAVTDGLQAADQDIDLFNKLVEVGNLEYLFNPRVFSLSGGTSITSLITKQLSDDEENPNDYAVLPISEDRFSGYMLNLDSPALALANNKGEVKEWQIIDALNLGLNQEGSIEFYLIDEIYADQFNRYATVVTEDNQIPASVNEAALDLQSLDGVEFVKEFVTISTTDKFDSAFVDVNYSHFKSLNHGALDALIDLLEYGPTVYTRFIDAEHLQPQETYPVLQNCLYVDENDRDVDCDIYLSGADQSSVLNSIFSVYGQDLSRQDIQKYVDYYDDFSEYLDTTGETEITENTVRDFFHTYQETHSPVSSTLVPLDISVSLLDDDANNFIIELANVPYDLSFNTYTPLLDYASFMGRSGVANDDVVFRGVGDFEASFLTYSEQPVLVEKGVIIYDVEYDLDAASMSIYGFVDTNKSLSFETGPYAMTVRNNDGSLIIDGDSIGWSGLTIDNFPYNSDFAIPEGDSNIFEYESYLIDRDYSDPTPYEYYFLDHYSITEVEGEVYTLQGDQQVVKPLLEDYQFTVSESSLVEFFSESDTELLEHIDIVTISPISFAEDDYRLEDHTITFEMVGEAAGDVNIKINKSEDPVHIAGCGDESAYFHTVLIADADDDPSSAAFISSGDQYQVVDLAYANDSCPFFGGEYVFAIDNQVGLDLSLSVSVKSDSEGSSQSTSEPYDDYAISYLPESGCQLSENTYSVVDDNLLYHVDESIFNKVRIDVEGESVDYDLDFSCGEIYLPDITEDSEIYFLDDSEHAFILEPYSFQFFGDYVLEKTYEIGDVLLESYDKSVTLKVDSYGNAASPSEAVDTQTMTIDVDTTKVIDVGDLVDSFSSDYESPLFYLLADNGDLVLLEEGYKVENSIVAVELMEDGIHAEYKTDGVTGLYVDLFYDRFDDEDFRYISPRHFEFIEIQSGNVDESADPFDVVYNDSFAHKSFEVFTLLQELESSSPDILTRVQGVEPLSSDDITIIQDFLDDHAEVPTPYIDAPVYASMYSEDDAVLKTKSVVDYSYIQDAGAQLYNMQAQPSLSYVEFVDVDGDGYEDMLLAHDIAGERNFLIDGEVVYEYSEGETDFGNALLWNNLNFYNPYDKSTLIYDVIAQENYDITEFTQEQLTDFYGFEVLLSIYDEVSEEQLEDYIQLVNDLDTSSLLEEVFAIVEHEQQMQSVKDALPQDVLYSDASDWALNNNTEDLNNIYWSSDAYNDLKDNISLLDSNDEQIMAYKDLFDVEFDRDMHFTNAESYFIELFPWSVELAGDERFSGSDYASQVIDQVITQLIDTSFYSAEELESSIRSPFAVDYTFDRMQALQSALEAVDPIEFVLDDEVMEFYFDVGVEGYLSLDHFIYLDLGDSRLSMLDTFRYDNEHYVVAGTVEDSKKVDYNLSLLSNTSDIFKQQDILDVTKAFWYNDLRGDLLLDDYVKFAEDVKAAKEDVTQLVEGFQEQFENAHHALKNELPGFSVEAEQLIQSIATELQAGSLDDVTEHLEALVRLDPNHVQQISKVGLPTDTTKAIQQLQTADEIGESLDFDSSGYLISAFATLDVSDAEAPKLPVITNIARETFTDPLELNVFTQALG